MNSYKQKRAYVVRVNLAQKITCDRCFLEFSIYRYFQLMPVVKLRRLVDLATMKGVANNHHVVQRCGTTGPEGKEGYKILPPHDSHKIDHRIMYFHSWDRSGELTYTAIIEHASVRDPGAQIKGDGVCQGGHIVKALMSFPLRCRGGPLHSPENHHSESHT